MYTTILDSGDYQLRLFQQLDLPFLHGVLITIVKLMVDIDRLAPNKKMKIKLRFCSPQAKIETRALKAKRPGFSEERYNETEYYFENGKLAHCVDCLLVQFCRLWPPQLEPIWSVETDRTAPSEGILAAPETRLALTNYDRPQLNQTSRMRAAAECEEPLYLASLSDWLAGDMAV